MLGCAGRWKCEGGLLKGLVYYTVCACCHPKQKHVAQQTRDPHIYSSFPVTELIKKNNNADGMLLKPVSCVGKN